MKPKALLFPALAVLISGCGMSDQELKDKTGDAAVSVKHAAETAGDKLKGAYDEAAIKGREAMKDAGAKLSDETLKAKVLAGFHLVKDLDGANIKVDVRDGIVYLSGTVPSQLDKYKAEGVAYGVTGDSSKFVSTITVGK